MNVFAINELRNKINVQLRNMIPNTPGVYKWWCKIDLLEKIIHCLDLDCHEVLSDIEKTNHLLLNTIDDANHVTSRYLHDEYYCVYVGDSTKLKNRILNQHIGGNTKSSTFRLTLAAVLLGCDNKLAIDEIQDQMLIEPMEYTLENYHIRQNELINEHFRPLNNDDIDADNNLLYSEARHYYPTANGRSRKSSLITDRRRTI